MSRRGTARSLGVLLLLAACGTPESEDLGDSRTRQTTAAPGIDTDAATSSGSTGPGRVMTDEQLTEQLSDAPAGPRLFADTLDDYWDSTRLPGKKPEVEPIRVVNMSEANDAHFDCMETKGFPSEVDDFGQRGIEFSAEQHDAMKHAGYVCYASYPLDDKYFEPYSVEQLRAIYDWNITETSACLREQGVEPSEPPTFESVVAEYAQTGREYWTATRDTDLSALQQQCPETPPDDVLYPSG